jgi:hypothetical protein
MTGVEYEGETPPEKTVLIIHHGDDAKELKAMNCRAVMGLAPTIFAKLNIPSILGLFRVPVKSPSSRKTHLLIAGLTNPENKDITGVLTLMRAIRDGKFKSNIVIDVINYFELEKEWDEFVELGICVPHIDTSSENMFKLLNRANYVLVIAKRGSSYHKKQLSGIIPLAVSTGTPLVMDEKLSSNYGFNEIAITYTFNGRGSLTNGVRSALATDAGALRKKVLTLRNGLINAQSKCNTSQHITLEKRHRTDVGKLVNKKDKKDFFDMVWNAEHNHKDMYKNLEDFTKVMKSENIYFWLGEGTALGAIRKGKIIPGDSDVDVGVWYEERKRFIEYALPKLKDLGFRLGRVYPLSIYRDNNYIDIDFTGKGKRCMAIYWPNKCDDFIHLIKPFRKAKLNRKTYNVPSEAYIVKLYGKTWRVPQDLKPIDIQ